MKMPGYDDKIARDAAAAVQREAERIADQERARKEQQKKEQEQKAAATEKLQQAKRKVIKQHLKPKYIKERGLEYANHMGRISVIVGVAWLLGSAGWLYERYGKNNGALSYKTVMQHQFGFKNAFNPDATEEERKAGLFGSIANYLLICALIVLSENVARKNGQWGAKSYQKYAIDNLLQNADKLKNFGISESDARWVHDQCGEWLISKLSEIDRGYLENLLKGGLDNVKFETAAAIIAGHLKSHPNDYAEIIRVIDEATLPHEIVEKYGAGKTISFAAAKAMSEIQK